MVGPVLVFIRVHSRSKRSCFLTNPKKNTVRNYLFMMNRFIKDTVDPALPNPCENAVLKKVFKEAKPDPWVILEKDTVDEIIFQTTNTRSRLMPELMARGCLRINEVLKLRPADVQDRKLVLKTPKSGKDAEVAFIPAKVADRLAEYIRQQGFNPDCQIFAMSYTSARLMVARAENLVGISLKPHDLRRFAATYASRAGPPIEIVSKIILRHANLSTTQRYLGKASDAEAL
ncbi:MAG: tyrosine-type recombinase/integrase [Desulfatirhabdiaceae bacterium]